MFIWAPGYINTCYSPCGGKNGALLFPSIRGRRLFYFWQQTWHWAAVKVVKKYILCRFPSVPFFPVFSCCLSPLTLRQCFTFITHFWTAVLSSVWLICEVALLSGIICFGCKYDKLGTDKDFTENSRTLSLCPLSWPHFICCGPKKSSKSFFSRIAWVFGLNVIRSVFLTNFELIALLWVFLCVKAFQVKYTYVSCRT